MKWRLNPSSRLATTDTGRKLGAVPLWEGELVPMQHNMAWAEAYLHTKWHLDLPKRLATIHQRLDTGQTDRRDRQTTVR